MQHCSWTLRVESTTYFAFWGVRAAAAAAAAAAARVRVAAEQQPAIASWIGLPGTTSAVTAVQCVAPVRVLYNNKEA